MGKSRAGGAALVAAAVVLSGCGAGDGKGTTTAPTSATEQPGNPWDLPLEQRLALFDPCAEIPIDAIEHGIGRPAEQVRGYERHRPGDRMACNWRTDDAELTILTTWKSPEDYLADRELTVVNTREELNGRVGMRLVDAIGDPDRWCLHLLFTERGAVWIQVHLNNFDKEFDGQRVPNACAVMDQVSEPLMEHLPEGDFH
ncbi:hypothetical protein NCCP2495_34220 [Dietzia sp. NCCP-2495]|nr:hypothetical protein NCCP2495_34220 [Dietzia sp. NCCP-2495]